MSPQRPENGKRCYFSGSAVLRVMCEETVDRSSRNSKMVEFGEGWPAGIGLEGDGEGEDVSCIERGN